MYWICPRIYVRASFPSESHYLYFFQINIIFPLYFCDVIIIIPLWGILCYTPSTICFHCPSQIMDFTIPHCIPDRNKSNIGEFQVMLYLSLFCFNLTSESGVSAPLILMLGWDWIKRASITWNSAKLLLNPLFPSEIQKVFYPIMCLRGLWCKWL